MNKGLKSYRISISGGNLEDACSADRVLGDTSAVWNVLEHWSVVITYNIDGNYRCADSLELGSSKVPSQHIHLKIIPYIYRTL